MNFILLQDSTGDGQPGAGSFIFQFLPIVLIIAVVYFLMLRPQSKRQQEEVSFRENLKKGDKVMTIGGIFGRVDSIEENAIYIIVDKEVKLKMAKEAIRPAPENEPAK